MRNSWEAVANTLAAHMSLRSLRRALASEIAYLERDGHRMNATDLATTKDAIQFLEVWIDDWKNK